MVNCYLGTIIKVLDPDLYKISIDLPGLCKEAEAFPMRGEIDEPRPGDQVLVRDIDPLYHSFFLYSKIKDNEFIGYRSRGKMVQISEDEINLSIFDPKEKYEENENEIPQKIKAFIKVTKKGDIEIDTKESSSGDLKIEVKGDVSIKADGKATVDSPDVTIKGGTLKVSGTVTPKGTGPFCALPTCVLTGAPHVGPKVRGT